MPFYLLVRPLYHTPKASGMLVWELGVPRVGISSAWGVNVRVKVKGWEVLEVLGSGFGVSGFRDLGGWDEFACVL